MRIADALSQNRQTTTLFSRGAYLEGLRLMVRWRTDELERETGIRFSDDDIERLSQAALHALKQMVGEAKLFAHKEAYAPQLIVPIDKFLQHWTALWGKRIIGQRAIAEKEVSRFTLDPLLREYSDVDRAMDKTVLLGPVDKALIEAGFPPALLTATLQQPTTDSRSPKPRDDRPGEKTLSLSDLCLQVALVMLIGAALYSVYVAFTG